MKTGKQRKDRRKNKARSLIHWSTIIQRDVSDLFSKHYTNNIFGLVEGKHTKRKISRGHLEARNQSSLLPLMFRDSVAGTKPIGSQDGPSRQGDESARCSGPGMSEVPPC